MTTQTTAEQHRIAAERAMEATRWDDAALFEEHGARLWLERPIAPRQR